jgi:hypothetical protein
MVPNGLLRGCPVKVLVLPMSACLHAALVFDSLVFRVLARPDALSIFPLRLSAS